jgi:hypothetical protein
MTPESIWDRARKMVAQCPHPTTLAEQLGKLSRRKNYGRTRVAPTLERSQVETVHDWQRRADLQ